MASIFTKIIQGEIPCYKVAENDKFFAFLDINPLSIGHTLVIPKKEIDYIFDLDDELYTSLMQFSKIVGKHIESVIPCKRIGILVFGLEVPHAHVHLIPINKSSDMDISKKTLKLTKEKFEQVAQKINDSYKKSL